MRLWSGVQEQLYTEVQGPSCRGAPAATTTAGLGRWLSPREGICSRPHRTTARPEEGPPQIPYISWRSETRAVAAFVVVAAPCISP